MEGGWWRQLSSPGGRASGADRRGVLRSPRFLYLSLVLAAGSWLTFQLSFVPSFARNNSAFVRASRQLLVNKPEILQATQRAGAVGVGYVAAVVPDSIRDVINDEDDDNLDEDNGSPGKGQAKKDDASENRAGLSERDYDFAPNRLTPVLKGRDGKKVIGGFPSKDTTSSLGLSKADEFALTWEYGAADKLIPYVGNTEWLKRFDSQKQRRQYLNSLATFPYATNHPGDFPASGNGWLTSSSYEPSANVMTRYHGHVGVYPNGTELWNPIPRPPPIPAKDNSATTSSDGTPQVNVTEALKRGGFYLDLANSLDMDRLVDDHRQKVCRRSGWEYDKLGDASVVITFYNEPLATLLRSVHSVLNNTPPSLLREIILVDDHSSLPENLPGDDLYEYVKLLPKTKVLRLPERRGLVWARLAGAQAAQGENLVVLDSHIEVNRQWLEPQLERIRQSPKSIVFPQILALDPRTFQYSKDRGIGCWLSWKWNMVEQASLTGKLDNDDPISSPSMAGGLFAANLKWFWDLGGYDEQFSMWGSENVEMGFRAWMCGGRLECTPCALTYHIYRDHGTGYSSPDQAVMVNKLRTARIWMDEYYLIAREYIRQDAPIGNLARILRLKKNLQCKDFRWFLENVDPSHDIQKLEDVEFFGEIRLKIYDPDQDEDADEAVDAGRPLWEKKPGNERLCVDSLSHSENETFGSYACHSRGGTQRWLKDRTNGRIRSGSQDTNCLALAEGDKAAAKDSKVSNTVMTHCTDPRADAWVYDNTTSQFVFTAQNQEKVCLTAIDLKELVRLEPCDSTNPNQRWEYDQWVPPPFVPIEQEYRDMLESESVF